MAVVDLVVALLGFAATRPDTFSMQRSMRRTYSGAPNGAGSVYEWTGNRKAGAGRLEIAESSPSSKITIKLDFVKPIEGHNVIEFTLEPKGEATNVTWAMHGPNPYFAKVMSIFCSMDKMVGKDFETGLANLKTVAEKQAAGTIRRQS